jgi:DNA polymerase III subunit gamma/tau
MPLTDTLGSDLPAVAQAAGEYIVVARRYRPQTFTDLVGQQHVAQALAGAITSNKVGHAYLFTGARGVGKTSAARILAKALNCVRGPTPTPCNECDICRAVSSGDDVDVLEIDGASNRGIEEMRQLRQNVNVRPSRARFKIYIIDEVHMLTKEAFNALLKTLEEPPEHVKFIFCTTEPEKIPITILSRCQKFDFAGIQTQSIAERLRQIVEAEGVEAEGEALQAIARRAAGSMRDSQSLLEQLLAFGGGRLTLEDVHRMLGTAGDRRLVELANHLVARDGAAAVASLDRALFEGVDVGPLLDQLLGYFRDVMVTLAGAPAELMLHSSPGDRETVEAAGQQLGMDTVLAIMQIIDQTLSRLRYSTHGRILAELALLRICRLEDLEAISGLIDQLRDGTPAAVGRPRPTANVPARQTVADPPKKKADEPVTTAAEPQAVSGSANAAGADGSGILADTPAGGPIQEKPVSDKRVSSGPNDGDGPPAGAGLTADNVGTVWNQVLEQLGDLLAEMARLCDGVAICAPNRLGVSFQEKYTSCKTFCERPENLAKLERALAAATGQTVRVEFSITAGPPTTGPIGEPGSGSAEPPRRVVSPQQRLREKAEHPMVRRAAELFGAVPIRVEEPEAARR